MFPKDLRTILMHLSRQAFTHLLIVLYKNLQHKCSERGGGGKHLLPD